MFPKNKVGTKPIPTEHQILSFPRKEILLSTRYVSPKVARFPNKNCEMI